MTTQAYQDWISAGKPYVLARPTRELQLTLRGYGYTVYDYPNTDHQLADPPEDHTPYSATGWPVASRRWIAHAIDIMPPGSAAYDRGAIALPALARQIIAAKDADLPGARWIKYINWTDENGVCQHVSWQSAKAVRSSTDKGHIHISGRSDMDDASTFGWDPVKGNSMARTITDDDILAFWSVNLGSSVNPVRALDRLNQVNVAVQALLGRIPADLTDRLAATLAAALDDGDTTVVLPPDAIADIQAIQSALAALPKAVVDIEAARLAS